ncbi:MAG: TlpA family protein disulfide reductase [Planctomycetes bacterium]|nr:TlpA family protein disulfide reductase [Planctomycetota bacterium]MBI3847801.1 TlpA family protein disulfide reductase [Planctomycetota bacterium]
MCVRAIRGVVASLALTSGCASLLPAEHVTVELTSDLGTRSIDALASNTVSVPLQPAMAANPRLLSGEFEILGQRHVMRVDDGSESGEPFAEVDGGERVVGAVRQDDGSEIRRTRIQGTFRPNATSATAPLLRVDVDGEIGTVSEAEVGVAPLAGSVRVCEKTYPFVVLVDDATVPNPFGPENLSIVFDRDGDDLYDGLPHSGEGFACGEWATFPEGRVRLNAIALAGALATATFDVTARPFWSRPVPFLGVGDLVPDIQATTLGGSPFALSSLRGRQVTLVFWASWCGPCREELRRLVALRDDPRIRNVTIVGVNLDVDLDAARVAAHDLALPFLSLAQPGGWDDELPTLFGIGGIPNSARIDADGRLAEHHSLDKIL